MLKTMEPSRVCFQLIHNVLVERTAGTAHDIVSELHDGISQVLASVKTDLEETTAKRLKLQQDYASLRAQEASAKTAETSARSASNGILV